MAWLSDIIHYKIVRAKNNMNDKRGVIQTAMGRGLARERVVNAQVAYNVCRYHSSPGIL